MRQIAVEEYSLWVNDTDYEEQIVRPVLVGNEYDAYIDPHQEDIWLDIGAHVGSFTMRYASHVKYIHAYEPHPDNFSCLVRNVMEHRLYRSAMVYNLAVVGQNSDPVVDVWESPGINTGAATVVRRVRGRNLAGQVNTILFRNCLSTTMANAVKLDVEGAEYDILMTIPLHELARLDELIMEYHFQILKDKDWGMYHKVLGILDRTFNTVTAKRERDGSWTTIVHATNRDV